jgi:DDE family transposase
MNTSIEHQMIELYCFVDEFLKTHPRLAHWRHSPYAQPQFSDAEVLTIAWLQGVFEVATLNQTYRLVAQNWRTAFPQLPSYKQGVSRVHHLLPQVGRLLATTCTHVGGTAHLYLIESNPIPLCQPIRHGRVRLLRDEGAYFGKSSKGWFFGFKLQLLRHIDGRVLNIVLTPGNYDDRVPALALVQAVAGGVTLGDLGYRGPECAAALAEEAEMLLITRDQAPTHRFVLSQVRQQVETTFSQLWRKFVDRVFSRSWSGLWNTIQLKVLYYNLRHAGILSA